MSIDLDKVLADVTAIAQPELEKRAALLKDSFMSQIDEFVDSSRVEKLDTLIADVAAAQVKSVMSTDATTSAQWAEVAADKLSSIRIILISEQIVASREFAAMIESAAIVVWEGFKSVAAGVLNVAVKAVVNAVVPGGGALADAATGFLGEAINGLVEPE